VDKLTRLIKLCKCGVQLYVNEHRNYYQTVGQQFDETDKLEDVTLEVLDEMKKRDIMIEVHFYPETPVGFYRVYHYDLESALDEAIKIVEREYPE